MSTPAEERGDLLISNLWKHQNDCFLEVRTTDLDVPSNIHRKPEVLPTEKKKYVRDAIPGIRD